MALLDAMSETARTNNSADSLAVINTNANYVNEMLLNIFGRADIMLAVNYTNALNAGLIARSALSAHLNLFGTSSGDAGFMIQNVNFINSAYQRLFNKQISNEKLLNFLNYLNAGGDKGEVILAMLDPQSQSADEAKTLENKSIALDEFSKNFYKYNDSLSPKALLAARIEATNAINLVTSQTLNPAAVIDNNIATYTAAYGEPSPIPIPDPTPTPPTPPTPELTKVLTFSSPTLDLASTTYKDADDIKDATKLIMNDIKGGNLSINGTSTTVKSRCLYHQRYCPSVRICFYFNSKCISRR